MSLVLDSSATLAWIYSDETTQPIRRVFEAVADEGAVVPSLWRLEIANSLTVAMRRGRIDADFRRASLADLALMDIAIDQHTDVHAWTDTLNLADRFRLTLYDAAYLELATRCRLPLATIDDELCTAATALGLELLGRD
ncbi:MAG: type II toxin-antitoxin system VapC family toxin [Hyphomicrobiales bacterium]|nr:type II toxin-antitoxin system VapC family toxin [Hyphomicrobiales bacterium]